MSKAADQLNIALSAASRRLSLLEREAGVPLIVRRPHGIEPTAAGITMMNYARDVMRLGDKLRSSLAEHRSGIRGYVRVCASSSVLVQRLAQDLSRFVTENPQIKLDLVERPSQSTIDAVLHKQADIGVVVRGFEVEGLATLAYGGDCLAVAVPNDHPFARRRSLSFCEVLSEDLVALEGGTAVHHLLAARARESGRPMRVRVQVRSFEVMSAMVGAGLGIGILPERALQPLANAMGIRLVRLSEPWAKREYAICMLSREELDAPSQRLVEFLTVPESSAAIAKNSVPRATATLRRGAPVA